MAVLDSASQPDQQNDPRFARRDPDIYGESSRSAMLVDRRSTAQNEAGGESSRQKRDLSEDYPHDHRPEPRSPGPAPVPAVASGPRPTQAPSRRQPDEPELLRLRAYDFAELIERDDRMGPQILGPFYPRNTDELATIKRQVAEKRRRRGSRPDQLDGVWRRSTPASAAEEASDVLYKRSADPEAMDEDLPRREGLDSAEMERRIELTRRQTAAEERCYVGNQDLSCFPTAGTEIVQNDWSRFIWNANYPLFIASGYVDVYLFQQDTDKMVTSWTRQDNGAGRLSFRPTDLWWARRQAADNIQPGQNISWPFYFVVLPTGDSLTGTTSRLATWSAIQTAVPVSIASSRSAMSASLASAASASSASAAAASATTASGSTRASQSSASATASPTPTASIQSAIQSSLSEALESSLRANGLTGTETLVGTTTFTLPNDSLVTVTATAQANGERPRGDNNGNGLALPTYAIVLISVLGFLALVAAIAGAYLVMAAARKRRDAQNQQGSFGSGSPMMAAAAGSLAGVSTDGGHAGEASHMLEDSQGSGAAGLGGAGLAAGAGAGYLAGAAGRTRSLQSEDSHLFTSDEASRMADAFRNALRRPEFAPTGFDDGSGGELSGESPTEDTPELGGGSRVSALLREELAAEGKDLRDVGDRKKATLHGD